MLRFRKAVQQVNPYDKCNTVNETLNHFPRAHLLSRFDTEHHHLHGKP
jgi:hypothetical protein